MELFHALGLDIRILIAQFINFAVLVFVLYRFAYQPILDLLEKRKRTIEEGLKNADAAQDTLEQAKEKSNVIIDQAKKEARSIIDAAYETAQKNAQTILEESKADAQSIVDDARAKMQKEKERIMDDVRADMTNLVVLATEKLIQERFDAGHDKQLIESVFKKLQ